jgi:membrane protein required for colicin V production
VITDLLLGCLIGLGIFFGFKKGFLVELITMLAFIIAIISAFKLLHTALEFVSPYIKSGSFAVLLSFILVFTIVFVLIVMLGKILKTMIGNTFLGVFDKVGGAIIGGLKATFSVSMILWMCHNARIDNFYKEYTADAFIYPYMVNFAPEFIRLVSYVIPFRDIFPAIKGLLS